MDPNNIPNRANKNNDIRKHINQRNTINKTNAKTNKHTIMMAMPTSILNPFFPAIM